MPATSIEAQKEVELYTNRQGYIMFRLEEVGSILPEWMDERERVAQSNLGRQARKTHLGPSSGDAPKLVELTPPPPRPRPPPTGTVHYRRGECQCGRT